MKRLPRDVAVQIFKSTPNGPRFLMLRRPPHRRGFWQAVTGAPLAGETDIEAAIREVREETGLEVSGSVFPLGITYAYALRPELADRWRELYSAGIDEIAVVAFGAEVPDGVEPTLDPAEHDRFRWCGYEQADAMLDWPIESDALAGRREALRVLLQMLS